MTFKKNQQYYTYKAAIYQGYADYYKYSNPSLHIHYYLKHLKNLYKGLTVSKRNQFSLNNHLNPPAYVRVIHSATNLPSLQLFTNGKLTITELPYNHFSDYQTISAGNHHVELYPNKDSNTSLLTETLQLSPGKFYTLIVTGLSSGPRLIAIEDDPNVPAGEAKIRFIHLASTKKELDIAVKNRDVIFPKLQFLKSTPYLGINPMNLELEARKIGTMDVTFDFPTFKLNANTSYSAILADEGKVFLLQDEYPEQTC